MHLCESEGGGTGPGKLRRGKKGEVAMFNLEGHKDRGPGRIEATVQDKGGSAFLFRRGKECMSG